MSTDKNERHIETRYEVGNHRRRGPVVFSAKWRKCSKSWKRESGKHSDWPGCRIAWVGDHPPGWGTRAEAIMAKVHRMHAEIASLEAQIEGTRRDGVSLRALLPEMEALDAKDAEANR